MYMDVIFLNLTPKTNSHNSGSKWGWNNGKKKTTAWIWNAMKLAKENNNLINNNDIGLV